MARIRKSMAGDLPILVPEGKGPRRERSARRSATNWGRLAWFAIALGAAGLLAWLAFVRYAS